MVPNSNKWWSLTNYRLWLGTCIEEQERPPVLLIERLHVQETMKVRPVNTFNKLVRKDLMGCGVIGNMDIIRVDGKKVTHSDGPK